MRWGECRWRRRWRRWCDRGAWWRRRDDWQLVPVPSLGEDSPLDPELALSESGACASMLDTSSLHEPAALLFISCLALPAERVSRLMLVASEGAKRRAAWHAMPPVPQSTPVAADIATCVPTSWAIVCILAKNGLTIELSCEACEFAISEMNCWASRASFTYSVLSRTVISARVAPMVESGLQEMQGCRSSNLSNRLGEHQPGSANE